MAKTEITRADIMPMAEYAGLRRDLRRRIIAHKRDRRVPVGPYAVFHFEDYDTMWAQVHEMLFIEGGGEAQIPDELAAYNPLIPKGSELVATLLIEVEDEVRRRRFLATVGGIEHRTFLTVGGERIAGLPELDVERTDASGKASSVHFLHFPFSPAQIGRFRDSSVPVTLGIDHPHYGHMAVLPDAARRALSQDFC